jgi:HEAT repeat protein
LSDDNEAVRLKAAVASFYARWAQLIPALSERAEKDPDDEVRRIAALAVQTIGENSG